MARHVPALVVVISALGAVGAFAQTRGVPAAPVTVQASVTGGRITGVVRDDVGGLLGDVSVVAFGTTLASVRSDSAGRFSLALPAGEYILRATRAGYVSTYREPVRVLGSVPIERNITLLRQSSAEEQQLVLASLLPQGRPASAGGTAASPSPGDHAHSEMAWRLRNLPRTVLRDEGGAAVAQAFDRRPADFRADRSFFDRAVTESARAATSFFTDTDFRGQLNFVTSGSLAVAGRRLEDWSRGVASGALGAPVGVRGDWMVRGAMATGDVSSWALVWEYDSRPGEPHNIHAGVSYASQGVMTASSASMGSATLGSRSVGSVYGRDRWRVHPGIEIEYGLRLDWFDYVATPNLVSPALGARIAVAPRTRLVASTARHMVAPGANEFLPPSSSGPWLPPERTFSPLIFGAALNVERVDHTELGLEYRLDRRGSRTVSVHRFSQSVTDQVSTLFGLYPRNDVGHYYVASSGDVRIDGWRAGLTGALSSRLSGAVAYTVTQAQWDGRWAWRSLRRLAPSAYRRGAERAHDLTASLHATLPSSTDVKVAYRINTAFSAPLAEVRLPLLDGRFEVEVRQALPYQPIRGGKLELLFAARSLLRDLDRPGSFYDELLTVAPPMRLTGGVQVRF